jgi:hypothetical protein
VPVSAGDVLGLRVHSMNTGCTFITGAGDTANRSWRRTRHAPGESMTKTSLRARLTALATDPAGQVTTEGLQVNLRGREH